MRSGYGNRIIARPYRIVPLSTDKALVICQARCVLVSSLERIALDVCSRMGTEGEQILRIMAAAGVGEDAAIHAIRELGSKTLLVGASRFLSEGKALVSQEKDRAIESIGIITRDRPSHLGACAKSVLENVRRFGRRVELVVIDDSSSESFRSRNLQELRSLSELAEIRYCGPEQRERYANVLFSSGLPRTAVQTALEPGQEGTSCGAARNTLLLDLAGTILLSADDDVVARVAVHPDRTAGLRLVGHSSCFDYRFFKSRKDALQWAQWTDEDLIGSHSRLVGKRVSECISEEPTDIDVNELCPHLVEWSMDPYVIGTLVGKIGDSGRSDASWMDWVEQRWAGEVEDAGDSEGCEIAELPKSPAIAHYIGCMTTMYGLDNRGVTPPFMPNVGGEDTVFGALLSRIAPNACWGVVPHAIMHDRPGSRSRRRTPGFTLSALLCVLFNALPRALPGQSMGEAIEDTGVELCRLARMRSQDLRCVAIEYLGRGLSTSIAEMDRRIRGRLPEPQRDLWIRRRNERFVEFERFCGLALHDNVVTGCELNWEELPVRLRAYGELLTYWPLIVDTVMHLRTQGIRASQLLN